MAGLAFEAQSPEVATGTTKKTVLQILAPTNQRVLVSEWSISFEGLDPVGTPIQVTLERQSTAGSGGDPLTPVKTNSGDDETIQTTALSDIDTSQPTETATLRREKVHPQGGYTWQAPFGKEIVVKGGERLGITVFAAVTVDCVATFRAEE